MLLINTIETERVSYYIEYEEDDSNLLHVGCVIAIHDFVRTEFTISSGDIVALFQLAEFKWHQSFSLPDFDQLMNNPHDLFLLFSLVI